MEEEINLHRNLVCIKFPGIVENADKAIQCLGGIRSISQVYSENNKRRLGLSFQPDNPYIKRIFADACKTSGLVLKVKVKKQIVNNEVTREVISTTVVGRVNKIYKFESLCDFQYLPLQIEENRTQCILENLLPSGLNDFSFLNEPAPLFIVPPNFTRSDKPIPYLYTYKKYPEHKNTPENDDMHHKVRSDRGLPACRCNFSLTDDIPTEPHEFYIKHMDEKIKIFPSLKQDYETVKKLFEERPIWSLNLLKYHTKIRISVLKTILPCLALNMKGGPWKILWVRFGYDPRKEPGARIYQCLDFRIRNTPGLPSLIMTKDETIHKYKKAERVRSQARSRNDEEFLVNEEVPEGTVYFRPGLIPAQRQVYYQYCDIHLPEVQELLAVEPPPGYLCHPKRGWLAPNTDEICRDYIYQHVKKTLRSTLNADLKFEQGSSDDDNSEDEGSNAGDGVEGDFTIDSQE